MRWSLFSLVTLLVVLIVDVIALPISQDGSELSLELPRNQKLRASSFKKHSSAYRRATLKSTHPMLFIKLGKMFTSKAPKIMPKKMDADHIFEAQTFKVAAERALASLAPAMGDIKDRINDPKNMAFLDPATNRAKGRAHTSFFAGKIPPIDPNVKKVLQQHSAASKSTATADQTRQNHSKTWTKACQCVEVAKGVFKVTRSEKTRVQRGGVKLRIGDSR